MPYERDLIAERDEKNRLDSSVVKWWRVNYIDQAILLVATSEILTAKVDRAVAIDEAVNIAKEYSDDESFKYINGVLDQIK